MGMIATASHGVIFLWDYEFLRVIGSMTNNYNEVYVLEFLDPYPLLASVDASGDIVIWDKLKQFS